MIWEVNNASFSMHPFTFQKFGPLLALVLCASTHMCLVGSKLHINSPTCMPGHHYKKENDLLARKNSEPTIVATHARPFAPSLAPPPSQSRTSRGPRCKEWLIVCN